MTLGAAMLSAGPRATGVQASVRWLPTPQVAIELAFGRLAAPGLLDFPFVAGTDLFLGGRTFAPYAHVAIGAESLQIDDARAAGDVSTFEAQLGGGLELRFSRHWAIDGEIDLVQRRVVQSNLKSTEPPVPRVTPFDLQTSGGSTVTPPATVQVGGGFAANLSLVAYF